MSSYGKKVAKFYIKLEGRGTTYKQEESFKDDIKGEEKHGCLVWSTIDLTAPITNPSGDTDQEVRCIVGLMRKV